MGVLVRALLTEHGEEMVETSAQSQRPTNAGIILRLTPGESFHHMCYGQDLPSHWSQTASLACQLCG